MKLEQKKQEIENALIGKEIIEVKYYQSANSRFHYNQERFHLCEVGMELLLSDNHFFFFGWDFDYELIDSKPLSFENIKLQSQNSDAQFLEDRVTNDLEWQNYVHTPISNIEIKWNWFEDLTENRHDIPVELTLQFANHHELTIGAYQMEINHDEGLVKADNDSEGVVMIFFNPA
jgi:hypothetical protein